LIASESSKAIELEVTAPNPLARSIAADRGVIADWRSDDGFVSDSPLLIAQKI
jgi:hypothetical protein